MKWKKRGKTHAKVMEITMGRKKGKFYFIFHPHTQDRNGY
jgi:hypothetical protein